MPSVGGLSIANNLLSNNAQLYLNKNQDSLKTAVTRLSSGLRINTAADDPSGLAIAESLQAQVNGFDQAVRNVQDANNAAQVAEGALQTETDILQRVRTLAVEAASDISSKQDRSNLQVEVNQLLLEVNRISQNTSFNGNNLLDGSHAGFQPSVNATATITSNSALAVASTGVNSGFLVQSVQIGTAATNINTTAITGATLAAGEVANGSTGSLTLDGTIELQVIQQSQTSLAVQVTFFNSQTGGLSVAFVTTGNSAFGGFDNVTVNIGNFTSADVGVTSFVKVSQFVPVASNPTAPAFNFQSGADEGAVIQVGFQATNTQTLRISNINLLAGSQGVSAGGVTIANPSIGAEDAIGQIDHALEQLLGQRAALGAVIVRLNQDAANDNIASVNLQAAESNIRDLNVGAETTQYTKLQILVQVGTSVLAQSNQNAQSVLGLFR